jgi:single-strand DNA-binding protein
MSARSLNKVMLIGNLTRDPELRYTPSGTAVCTIGLATNRSWVPTDGGDRQEETEYHRIVAWAKLAEICSQLLFKGRKVYVEGRLQTRKWTGQDGVERETTEVVIDSMIALGKPKNGGGGYADEGFDDAQYASNTNSRPTREQSLDVEDDVKSSSKAEDKAEAEDEDESIDVDDIPF